MPLSVVSLETINLTGVRVALTEILEANHYEILEDTSNKVVADHGHSLTMSAHMIDVEFMPRDSVDHSVRSTVNISICHKDSKDYVKFIVNKLLKVFPSIKIASAEPTMSFNLKIPKGACEPITTASSAGDSPSTIQGKWKCRYCGSENDLTLAICEHCGGSRHPSWEPEAFPDTEFGEEGNLSGDEGEKAENDDETKSIY